MLYFNKSTRTYFGTDDLRALVMHKLPIGTTNKPMCYCKNVLEAQVLAELLVKRCCNSLHEIKIVLNWAQTQRVDTVLLSEVDNCCLIEAEVPFSGHE